MSVSASNNSTDNMALNVEALTLQNEYFHTMEHDQNIEKLMFNGTYSMKRYWNPHSDLDKIVDDFYNIGGLRHFHCKQIYVLGNILYKNNEPEIDSMIDLIIRCTYENALPSYVDTSVKSKEQFKGGTICPSREVAFRYQGNLYVLYGRYIYGYNIPYVHFINEKQDRGNESNSEDKGDGEDVLDCDKRKDPLLTRDEIILPTISYSEKNKLINDYNYCFSILDEVTEEVKAFAVYR